jgi:hypothetical protein
MKRLLLFPLVLFPLVLLIVVGAPEPAHSQNLTVGLHAGGTFATFQGDTDEFSRRIQGVVGSGNTDLGRRAALRTGVFLEIPLTDVVSLRPEIVYAQKGATLEARGTQTIADQEVAVDLDGTLRFHYVHIPVLAVAEIPTETSLVPRFYVGPTVGFDVSSESELEASATLAGETQTETRTDDANVEDVDVGAVVGGELGYRIAPGQTIALDVRYNPSINSVNPEGDFDVRNDVLSVGVSYRFDL